MRWSSCSARCRPASRAPASAPGRQLYYQVETLIFGRAVERATQPERFIVGCADPAQPLPSRYRSVPARRSAARSCRCATRARSSPRSRSTAASSPRSASPTRWPSCARASAPTGRRSCRRCKLDRRIGPYSYLAPGLGIAGGNLERDLATVMRLGDGARHRRGGRRGLAVEQPAPPRLGAAHHASALLLDENPRRDGCGAGASPTRRTRTR